jgi:PIN domain nuclease of toxin-antitoxin system
LIEALLDTHPLLWVLAGSRSAPEWLQTEIEDDPSRFGVSDATISEIAIKRSTGKLITPEDLPGIIMELGFATVPVTTRQAWSVHRLPFHHRDPFDRLLIAQAHDLGVPLVSGDPAIRNYDVTVRW